MFNTSIPKLFLSGIEQSGTSQPVLFSCHTSICLVLCVICVIIIPFSDVLFTLIQLFASIQLSRSQ